MSTEPVRYGIVGLGRAGWDIHVKGLRGRTDSKIVAVADPDPARQQQAAAEFGCKTYKKIDQLIKQEDIEVVVVATPSALHGPDTKKALKKGKHVLVEKPMAMTPSEAKGMIELSKQVDRRLFVHQNYRFFRNFTYLQDVVNSGILGNLFHLRCYINNFSRRNDWQTLVKNGGGVLNNTCPHFIDQICQLVGAPITQVMGDLRQIASAGDVEDHVKAFMRAANGVTADMEITSVEKVAVALPRWIIAGSTGTLTVDADGKATIHYFDPAQAPKLEAVDGAASDRKYGNDDKLPWQVKEEKAEGTDVGNYYDDIFNVLRNGKQQRVSPESVLHVMEVIAMIRKGTNFPGKVIKPKTQPV